MCTVVRSQGSLLDHDGPDLRDGAGAASSSTAGAGASTTAPMTGAGGGGGGGQTCSGRTTACRLQQVSVLVHLVDLVGHELCTLPKVAAILEQSTTSAVFSSTACTPVAQRQICSPVPQSPSPCTRGSA